MLNRRMDKSLASSICQFMVSCWMSRVAQIRRACQKKYAIFLRLKFSGGGLNLSTRIVSVIIVCLFALLSEDTFLAEKFIIMSAGLSIRHTPFYYGQENGFFKDEGLEVQALVVRAGQVGIASLMSGEVDAITNAGTGLAASIRGLPVKI